MANVPITGLRVEGMRGPNHTIPAFMLPGQSRLTVLPEFDYGNKTNKEDIAQLALLLSGKR